MSAVLWHNCFNTLALVHRFTFVLFHLYNLSENCSFQLPAPIGCQAGIWFQQGVSLNAFTLIVKPYAMNASRELHMKLTIPSINKVPNGMPSPPASWGCSHFSVGWPFLHGQPLLPQLSIFFAVSSFSSSKTCSFHLIILLHSKVICLCFAHWGKGWDAS